MSIPARFALSWLCVVGALALAGHAFADAKKEKDKDKDAAAKPALVGSYGDWSVYQSQSGKTRICYALASPKERAPDDLKRDPAYAFISQRPSEHVRNEVSFVMGFELGGDASKDAKDPKDPKESKDSKDKKKSDSKEKKAKTEDPGPTATIGDSEFEMLPKGSNLWVKNPAQENLLVEEMRKGSQLKIRAASKRGKVTIDTYSLSGFKQAIDRALKDCPAS